MYNVRRKCVDFMKKYQEDQTNLSLLSEYYDMIKEYADYAEKIDHYNSDDMSAADTEYYLEVTLRCTQKLLSVIGTTDQ